MGITEYQKHLMEHTISGHNRNWFGTVFGCKDSIEFEKLVALGLATSEKAPSWAIDDVLYRLTQKGKDFLNNG